LGLSFLAACDLQPRSRLPNTLPPIEVHFSPHGGCTEAVVREIDAARSSILVQAYSFTSAPIAEALVAAKRRGVAVDVILDKSQESEKYSSADFLLHAGVSTRIDAKHSIAHNKIMIIDGGVVITGSFNFTKAAENSNAENLLVIRDRQMAAIYATNWQSHCEHAAPYEGKEEKPEHSKRARESKSREEAAAP
jgi:phosphatidylserine/phosphatidylglycerophosphate/cardiolipin synthase-like enzyme